MFFRDPKFSTQKQFSCAIQSLVHKNIFLRDPKLSTQKKLSFAIKSLVHKKQKFFRNPKVSAQNYDQKLCSTKNMVSQEHAPSETSEASLARRFYHKNMVSQKRYITKTCAERDERSESREALISQKHGNTKTWYHKNMRLASLARRLYHKNMVSQKLDITRTVYHIEINFWGLRLGIIKFY